MEPSKHADHGLQDLRNSVMKIKDDKEMPEKAVRKHRMLSLLKIRSQYQQRDSDSQVRQSALNDRSATEESEEEPFERLHNNKLLQNLMERIPEDTKLYRLMARSNKSKTRKQLLDFPPEILYLIAAATDNSGLRNLRLTCKQLLAVTDELFATRFFAHRSHVISRQSINTLLDITKHPVFGRYVTLISLNSVRITRVLPVTFKGKGIKLKKLVKKLLKTSSDTTTTSIGPKNDYSTTVINYLESGEYKQTMTEVLRQIKRHSNSIAIQIFTHHHSERASGLGYGYNRLFKRRIVLEKENPIGKVLNDNMTAILHSGCVLRHTYIDLNSRLKHQEPGDLLAAVRIWDRYFQHDWNFGFRDISYMRQIDWTKTGVSFEGAVGKIRHNFNHYCPIASVAMARLNCSALDALRVTNFGIEDVQNFANVYLRANNRRLKYIKLSGLVIYKNGLETSLLLKLLASLPQLKYCILDRVVILAETPGSRHQISLIINDCVLDGIDTCQRLMEMAEAIERDVTDWSLNPGVYSGSLWICVVKEAA